MSDKPIPPLDELLQRAADATDEVPPNQIPVATVDRIRRFAVDPKSGAALVVFMDPQGNEFGLRVPASHLSAVMQTFKDVIDRADSIAAGQGRTPPSNKVFAKMVRKWAIGHAPEAPRGSMILVLNQGMEGEAAFVLAPPIPAEIVKGIQNEFVNQAANRAAANKIGADDVPTIGQPNGRRIIS